MKTQLPEHIIRTIEEIISEEDWQRLANLSRPLILKYGVDLTSPHLHIGHAVNLWIYRALQELGHHVVLLLGDFTTTIGDPTDKTETRAKLSQQEIEENGSHFLSQALMVLNNDPKVFSLRRNSEWYETLGVRKFLEIVSLVTHEKLIARDMFRKRISEGKSIYAHELLYPLVQGYDSVVLQSDITVVGSDQLYNEMMGRTLQEKFNQPRQVVITTKITPGTDGGIKQSKSVGNYIGLNAVPREKFGKLMSIPDSLTEQYFRIYTDWKIDVIEQLVKSKQDDPMGLKLTLSEAIVARYHGQKAAQAEREWFIKTFSRKEAPENLREVRIGRESTTVFEIVRSCFSVEEKSNSEIRRLISQGAVEINGEGVREFDTIISLRVNKKGVVLRVGKRTWFRVI